MSSAGSCRWERDHVYSEVTVSLQGTLETFSLPDVLQLLSSTKKTGCLRLNGDRGSGSVWIRDGAIVGGEAVGAPHADGAVDVVFELLRYADGSFEFQDGGEPAESSGPSDVGEVLSSAGSMLDEWNSIAAVVPSTRHWVSLVLEISGEEVTLTADNWRAVAAVGSGLSAGSLGDDLSMGEMQVGRLIKDLKDQGLVEVGEPREGAGSAPAASPAASFDAAPAVTVPEPEPAPVLQAVPEPTHDRFDPGGLVIEDTAPAAAPAAAAAPEAPADGGAPAPGEAAEIARQLANLSPKAARAVAAAAKAATPEEREAALAEAEAADDQLNRDLLLKFLGTVN